MSITRRDVLRGGLLGAGALMGAHMLRGMPAWAQAGDTAKDAMNVLFIGVDDLRPVLGCYDYPGVHTPNLDALAARGTVFDRAYCQYPVCGPSRASLLTGLRPETNGVVGNRRPEFRKNLPDHVTLPENFKNSGWWSMEMGKIFHVRDPQSYSREKWIPETPYAYPIYGKPETIAEQKKLKAANKPDDWWGYKRWVRHIPWEAPEVEDNVLFDGQLADKAIEILNEVKGRPFFLAPGFFRPHLPFIAPKKYYDMYPLDSLELPDNRSLPDGAPHFATYHSAESRSYTGVPKRGDLPEKLQRELLRGYYASVSYVDAQIGRLLDHLKRTGLDKNTAVMLWGDHGYHFGEHGTWNKSTNFEEATRSTLIASVPGQKTTGQKAHGLVEFVDMYPTLCDVCGLETPDNLQGASFAPLLDSPGREWKKAAFSQARPRGRMGRSIRTDRYRYVEWEKDGEIVDRTLYDHQTDPGENVSVADDPEYAETVAELSMRLQRGFTGDGWKAELPDAARK
jgi:arylsulfatase A-like enzyme